MKERKIIYIQRSVILLRWDYVNATWYEWDTPKERSLNIGYIRVLNDNTGYPSNRCNRLQDQPV